jgi:hypothetical protein
MISYPYTLFWLKEKRLMEAVAKRMGKPHSTLVAERRRSNGANWGMT